MIFSFQIIIMITVLFLVYYIVPKRLQPMLLLIGSLYYYYKCSGWLLVVMIVTSMIAFFWGKLLVKYREHLKNKIFLCENFRLKICLLVGIILLLLPLFSLKYSNFVFQFINSRNIFEKFANIGLPIGISFYTLQLIAYCIDVYRGKYEPEVNFFAFLLFTCFFPQILQGPIPRYEIIKKTLFDIHEFEEKIVTEGIIRIIEGLFLKYMIADKAAIFVNAVFDTGEKFAGIIYLVAGIFYSFQLYTDFLACVFLAQGVALLFGVKLSENFEQPYFATSIKEFWRKWHISLSSWLRDYVYIPLGGNRKGKVLTNINLLITFGVSGIWHGVGYKYLFWGLLHGVYQIVGKYTIEIRNNFWNKVKVTFWGRTLIQRLCTFFLVMSAWIIFRANSLKEGIYALYAIVADFRLKEYSSIFSNFGLNTAELIILLISICILLICEHRMVLKEKSLTDSFSELTMIKLFMFTVAVILVVLIFGTYGVGYDANDFIYGGF